MATNTANWKAVYLDTGMYVSNVAPESIYELLDEYCAQPEFKARKCYVVGVQPCGTTNGVWSRKANAFTEEILTDAYVYVSFKV